MDGKQHLALGDLAGSSGMKTLADAIGSTTTKKKTKKEKGEKDKDEKNKDGKKAKCFIFCFSGGAGYPSDCLTISSSFRWCRIPLSAKLKLWSTKC